ATFAAAFGARAFPGFAPGRRAATGRFAGAAEVGRAFFLGAAAFAAAFAGFLAAALAAFFFAAFARFRAALARARFSAVALTFAFAFMVLADLARASTAAPRGSRGCPSRSGSRAR